MMSFEELKDFMKHSTIPLKTTSKLDTPLNIPLIGKYEIIIFLTVYCNIYILQMLSYNNYDKVKQSIHLKKLWNISNTLLLNGTLK
jgi:hypothetical protein